MKKSRNNRWKYFLSWLLITSYLMVILMLVSARSSETVCEHVSIQITDSLDNRFVDEGEILDVLKKEGHRIHGFPMTRINTKEIENTLLTKSMIKTAEVFKTANGTLNIMVTQRVPIARLADKNNKNFYIDKEGFIMPVSKKYTSHVMLVNGNFKKPLNIHNTSDNIENPVDKKNLKLLKDIYNLAKFIHEDNFWKSQVVQIYVTKDQEFEIIPRVGAHIIIFGTIEDHEEKFRKLSSLYHVGFNNVGWNQYEKINLKYKNQVICTKK